MTEDDQGVALVGNDQQVRDNIGRFNCLDDISHQELEWMVRQVARTSYWVYDPTSGLFGPSKFVGYAGMTIDRYRRWLSGPSRDRQRSMKRLRLLLKRDFAADDNLSNSLLTWGQNSHLKEAFRKGVRKQWRFIAVDQAANSAAVNTAGVERVRGSSTKCVINTSQAKRPLDKDSPHDGTNNQDTVLNQPGPQGRVYLESGAVFDSARIYRYRLWRLWDTELPRLLFIMLNPSHGDAFKLTQTSRFCDDIACWGLPVSGSVVRFGAVEIVNLFAYRSPDPSTLEEVIERSELEAVGPDNDGFIVDAVERSEVVVAAWGGASYLPRRDALVAKMARSRRSLFCLAKTTSGAPYHPNGILRNLRRLLREDESRREFVARSFSIL